jgi:hypothetical protein
VRTRRAFLAAAGAAVLAGGGGLVIERDVVRRWVADLTDPDPAAPLPTRDAGALRTGSFASRACGREVGWQLSYPPGSRPGDALPVALVLHGRGGDATSAFGELQLDGYLAAVAADSPALWQHASETASGAFDGSADFAAHDVFAHRDRLAGVPVRIAGGTADPFYPAVRAFLPGVPDLAGTDLSAGGHTDSFWRRSAPAQLSFLGGALARVG